MRATLFFLLGGVLTKLLAAVVSPLAAIKSRLRVADD